MKYICIITLMLFSYSRGDKNFSILEIDSENQNWSTVIIDSQTHLDYGLSYPITYKLSIPHNSQNLKAYRKYNSSQDWDLINNRTSDDFFNGVEAVRFDYYENAAYVSVGFSSFSDTIFIKIENNNDENVNASFINICEYYDNRRAVVTITADDWADYCNEKFVEACQNFRSFNLWYSVAIITGWVWNQNTWDDIQTQLDNGLIEPLAHSRTHPNIPYIDVEGEVAGSKQDIINNLNLLNHNRSGVNEYVYAWVAPFGEYDDAIDTMISNAKYLVSRLFSYNENYFSDWNSDLNKFDPIDGTIELGNSYYWGSADIDDLNNTFDNVVDSNKIYHLITHPNILDWNEDFTWHHLEYISNRKDIWYVGFGHLYLYRLLSNSGHSVNLNIMNNHLPSVSDVTIHQNYPNPFNPITTLSYHLQEDAMVSINIYNMLGNIVRNLVNKSESSGYKLVQWDATNNDGQPVSAGVYLYSIETEEYRQTKKMIFLK